MVRELEIINQCIIVSGESRAGQDTVWRESRERLTSVSLLVGRGEQARYCMVREPGKIKQCIIVSGESGAGKVMYGERARKD